MLLQRLLTERPVDPCTNMAKSKSCKSKYGNIQKEEGEAVAGEALQLKGCSSKKRANEMGKQAKAGKRRQGSKEAKAGKESRRRIAKCHRLKLFLTLLLHFWLFCHCI